MHAVADKGAGGWWVRRSQERQDEDVGVPEDVPAVSEAAQPPRTESGLGPVGNRSHEMEEAEAHGPLQLRIALDADVGNGPTACPGRTLLGEQSLDPDALGGLECFECRLGARCLPRVGGVGDESFEPQPGGRHSHDPLRCCDRDAAAAVDACPRAGTLTAVLRAKETAQRSRSVILESGALGHEHGGARASERREGHSGGIAVGCIEVRAQGSIPQVEYPGPGNRLLNRGPVPNR